MRYSERTPKVVLENSVIARKYILLFDEIEKHKESLVEKHTRFYNSPLLTDLRMLRKKLEDYGHPPIPHEFHKDQLDALMLNSNDLMAMKGSYKGLRLWLWCLTFGAITDNYEDFYPVRNFIIPNEVDTYGYVSNVVPPDDFMTLYLFSGADNFGHQVLNISIDTKYHWMLPLKKYIEENIFQFIGFVDANSTITVELLPGIYNDDPFPNQYFVIPD